MESDAERGVGSSEDGREELSQPLTIASLNRGMDSIVAKAGTLPTLKNVAGITSFERKFKSALEATPFGCRQHRQIRALRAPSDSSTALPIVRF